MMWKQKHIAVPICPAAAAVLLTMIYYETIVMIAIVERRDLSNMEIGQNDGARKENDETIEAKWGWVDSDTNLRSTSSSRLANLQHWLQHEPPVAIALPCPTFFLRWVWSQAFSESRIVHRILRHFRTASTKKKPLAFTSSCKTHRFQPTAVTMSFFHGVTWIPSTSLKWGSCSYTVHI